MPPIKDLTGQRLGRLSVIRLLPKRKHRQCVFECLCDCGNTVNVLSDNLKRGHTTSCGCITQEIATNISAPRLHKHNAEQEFKNGTKLCGLTQKTDVRNVSGCKGVFPNRRTRKWRASIMIAGKAHYLGEYAKLDDAIRARKLAEEEYFEPVLNKYGRTLYKED